MIKRLRSLSLGLALFAIATPTAAQPLSGASSTGADYMAASLETRLTWVNAAARAMKLQQPNVMALRLMRCLDEVLTARRRDEALAVAAYRNEQISTLTAMCAAIEIYTR